MHFELISLLHAQQEENHESQGDAEGRSDVEMEVREERFICSDVKGIFLFGSRMKTMGESKTLRVEIQMYS